MPKDKGWVGYFFVKRRQTAADKCVDVEEGWVVERREVTGRDHHLDVVGILFGERPADALMGMLCPGQESFAEDVWYGPYEDGGRDC